MVLFTYVCFVKYDRTPQINPKAHAASRPSLSNIGPLKVFLSSTAKEIQLKQEIWWGLHQIRLTA